MTLGLGYLVGTAIFAALFVVAVAAQLKAQRFHPVLHRVVIVATTTACTTLADFLDRSLIPAVPCLDLSVIARPRLGPWQSRAAGRTSRACRPGSPRLRLAMTRTQKRSEHEAVGIRPVDIQRHSPESLLIAGVLRVWMDRLALSDAMWARLAPLLPGKPGDPGRSAADNRLFMEAVLWMARPAQRLWPLELRVPAFPALGPGWRLRARVRRAGGRP